MIGACLGWERERLSPGEDVARGAFPWSKLSFSSGDWLFSQLPVFVTVTGRIPKGCAESKVENYQGLIVQRRKLLSKYLPVEMAETLQIADLLIAASVETSVR